MIVTRMNTPKQACTPYDVYTTKIIRFLQNRNLISNGKRSLKNQTGLPPIHRPERASGTKMVIFDLFQKASNGNK